MENNSKLNDSQIIKTIHEYQKKKKIVNAVSDILYLSIF